VAKQGLTPMRSGPSSQPAGASLAAGGVMESAETILTFHADWRVEQSSVLVAGSDVRIRYDIRRLLGGSDLAPTGPHSFNLSCHCRIDEGRPTSFDTTFDMGSRHPAGQQMIEHVVRLPPSARRLEIWFQRVA